MRLALNALTDELRRLKAQGVGSVSVSQEALDELRRSAAARPAPPPREKEAPRTAESCEPSGAAAAPTAVAPPVVVLPKGEKNVRWSALCAMVQSDAACIAKVRPGKK